MAQTSTDPLQEQIDQLRKEKEKLDAEKAKLEAQKALADAQRALDQAQSDEARQLAELQAKKALADAEAQVLAAQKLLDQAKSESGQQLADLQSQKALVDAQKNLTDALNQAALAKYIGEVKAGPYSGAVEMKEKVGVEEAALLAARAVKEAAVKVASELTCETKGKKVYLFASREFPSFQRLLGFRFRKELIKQAYSSAGFTKRADEKVEAVSAAMVSAGLDAFSKILGFFKTDYTVGGVEAKIDESLLLYAVAGSLSKAAVEVRLPLVFEPQAPGNAVTSLTLELGELIDLRTQAVTQAKLLKDQIANIEKQAADPTNALRKDQLLGTAASLRTKVEQINGVVALYDAFANSLTTPDTSGGLPLAQVVQELSIDSALKEGALVLLLRLENSGGGYLVKKNLWTGLGGMPLYHMGGATVTYLLLEGADGKVAAGNVIPVHGGFVKSNRVRARLADEVDGK